MTEKTHYRKAFNSPYLSSADIVEPTVLTISHVRLEADKTKKTKDSFNTAYFKEKELRQGEALKPMVLNAVNSRTMKNLTGSAFIDDWCDVAVTIFVDNNVKFGRSIVEGLRISADKPATITDKQKSEIEKLIADKGVDESAFLGYMKAKDINSIRQTDHKKAMLALSKANGKKETTK